MLKLLPPPTRALRHLFIAASAITLAACASATPYQPASKPGAFDGFSQQLIENDRARVSFGGNSLTKRGTVENYLLYRSAELAVERGYDTFTLEERDVETDRKVRVEPGFGGGYDPYFGYSFYSPGFGWSRGYRYSQFAGFNRRAGFGRSGFGSSRFGRSGFGRSGFGGSGFGFGGSSFGSGRYGYDPFFDDVEVREITKYRATAEVTFGRGTSSESAQTFNAREVLANLGSTIEFPDES